jgi:hypothetical protein
MKEIIVALQEEIAAAQKQRAVMESIQAKGHALSFRQREIDKMTGYIDGLKMAVNLLEKEQARELPY